MTTEIAMEESLSFVLLKRKFDHSLSSAPTALVRFGFSLEKCEVEERRPSAATELILKLPLLPTIIFIQLY